MLNDANEECKQDIAMYKNPGALRFSLRRCIIA